MHRNAYENAGEVIVLVLLVETRLGIGSLRT